MADTTQQDGQKTIVAFIVGLLIGGMLVWAFSGPTPAPNSTDTEPTATETEGENQPADTERDSNDDNAPTTTDTTEPVVVPTLPMGDGAVSVENQPASRTIGLASATFPISEGWIGVRDFDNDQLGMILGVVRFSESNNLVPTEIVLQRSTSPGRQYAVVIFTEDGDNAFNLATDVQIDQIFSTFTAQ